MPPILVPTIQKLAITVIVIFSFLLILVTSIQCVLYTQVYCKIILKTWLNKAKRNYEISTVLLSYTLLISVISFSVRNCFFFCDEENASFQSNDIRIVCVSFSYLSETQVCISPISNLDIT